MTVVDDAENVIEVVVEDRQLSLAIGKKGQNVRLAAKLVGFKIDIKSEEEKRREVEAQFESLGVVEETATLTLPGLDEDQLRKLSEAELDTADRILEATTAQLSAVTRIDESAAEQLQTAVREQVEAVALATAAAAETAADEESPAAERVEETGEDIVQTAEAPSASAPEEPAPAASAVDASEASETENEHLSEDPDKT